MYQLIRQLNDKLPAQLRKELGLTVPFMNHTRTEKISNEIHLWLHWARSQRASQLAGEYNFSEGDLLEWFGWKDIKTATRYSHKGYAKLGAKMLSSLSQCCLNLKIAVSLKCVFSESPINMYLLGYLNNDKLLPFEFGSMLI